METVAPLWLWATFVAIVLVSLFVDFVVLKKQGANLVRLPPINLAENENRESTDKIGRRHHQFIENIIKE